VKAAIQLRTKTKKEEKNLTTTTRTKTMQKAICGMKSKGIVFVGLYEVNRKIGSGFLEAV
jgi:hypothetical protein